LIQNIDIDEVCNIAIEAGNKLLEFFRKPDLEIIYKEDDSPVSNADYAANQIITTGLEALNYGFPILSEEGANIPYHIRKHWQTFWSIDPLDGTKEFLKGSENFAVNIALIHQNYPIAGVIYLPVSRMLYYAHKEGAFKMDSLKNKTI
jgi:3'(2'), 5'-bisphosphate nucleotidase